MRSIKEIELLLEKNIPKSCFERPAILAVSGGVDSIVLAHVYSRLFADGKIPEPCVFHLNHRLRKESDSDESLVAATAQSLGLGVHLASIDVGRFAKKGKLNLEEAGRILRYKNLERLQKRLNGIAVTAHHSDDFAESVLMLLTRGAGENAFHTLPMWGNVRGSRVFRPFLLLTKADLVSVAKNEGLTYNDDLSNFSPDFKRNRIRSSVLPALIEEGLSPTLLWNNFHDIPESLEPNQFDEFLELDRKLFLGGSRRNLKQLLDLSMNRLGLHSVNRDAVMEIFKQVDTSEFRKGLDTVRYETGTYCVWSSAKGAVWIFRKDGSVFHPFEYDSLNHVLEYGGKSIPYVLESPLELATFRPGFYAHTRGGTKKLKQIYQEMSLPAVVRRNLPLLHENGQVKRIFLSLWNGEDIRFT